MVVWIKLTKHNNVAISACGWSAYKLIKQEIHFKKNVLSDYIFEKFAHAISIIRRFSHEGNRSLTLISTSCIIVQTNV